MTYDTYLALAAALPGAHADKPFENDFETTVLRHGEGGKWFGLLMCIPACRIGGAGEERIWVVNLKCTPEEGFALRETFPAIRPAYHMNKLHWITIPLDADLPESLLGDLTERSFDLTAPKRRCRHQNAT